MKWFISFSTEYELTALQHNELASLPPKSNFSLSKGYCCAGFFLTKVFARLTTDVL